MKWLLVLLLVPLAAGQPHVEATVTLHLPGTPDTLVDHHAAVAPGAEPPGCTAPGRIEPTRFLRGFRFIDSTEEQSCREARYTIPIPGGHAESATVRFTADREVDVAADAAGTPAMVQDLIIDYGGKRQQYKVFEPNIGRHLVRDFEFQVPQVTAPLEVGWLFSDSGETTAEPAPRITTGNAFSASVGSPDVVFTGVPITVADVTEESYRIDQSTQLLRRHVLFEIPDMGGTTTLHFDTDGSDLRAVLGPDGRIPDERLVRSDARWSLDGALAGSYEIILESTVIQKPVFLVGLPVAGVLFPVIAGVSAAYAQRRWEVVAHTQQAPQLRRDRWLLIGTAIIVGVTIIWALMSLFGSMGRVPMPISGIIQHALLAVAGIVFLFLISRAIVEHNRAIELRHASELAEANRRLQRSNQDLESFASVASHDLQAPLRRVVGGLELFQLKYGDQVDADGRRFVDMAVDGGKHMQSMVRALLDYGRLERRAGDMEPIALDDVVRSAAYDVEEDRRQRQAEIEIDVSGRVQGSKALLRDLFGNLMTNALRYGRDGVAPHIRVRSRRVGDEVHIEVADNGRGIDQKHHEEVFDMFRRIHLDEGGTGIGLAICKRIAELHGGRIEVESALGKGSTFTVCLPKVDSPTPTDGP